MPLSSDCIQDKEKIPYGFFCENCKVYHMTLGIIIDVNHMNEDDYEHCIPNRCLDCDRELQRWKRQQEGIKQIKKQFKWSRHKFIKFGTIGLPGNKEFPTDFADEQIKSYREELVAKFKLLRRTKVWKSSVDGGKWFFEITSRTSLEQMHTDIDRSNSVVNVKLNPHLHVLFMGPSKMNYEDLQKECKRLQLGRFHFSPIKKGSKFQNALKYISAYLKKDEQTKGVNRGSFGFLQGNKK